MTRSGSKLAAIASALRPVDAFSTQKASYRSAVPTAATIEGSSSTTRTRFAVGASSSALTTNPPAARSR
jgi:hypothetical protein